MPKVIKIVLIGDSKDQMSLLTDFAHSKGNGWSDPKIATGMAQAALQVNNEAVTVQVYNTPDQKAENYGTEVVRLLADAHVVLTVLKPNEQDYQNLNWFVEQTIAYFNSLIKDWLFNGIEYSEAKADASYLLPLFHISARADSVFSLRSMFNTQCGELNITVTESKPTFIANYLKNRLLPAIQKGRIKPKEEHVVFSRVSGSLIGAVIGTLAAIFVYNPLASLFAAASGLVKNKSFKDFALLLVSPIWGPLYGLFYKGLYLQGRRGWEFGFKKSFNALIDVPRNATLKEKTPISGRNIIASLAIILLSIAAAGSVLISPVSLGLGIPTFVIALGLSGISLPWLALLAGAATLVATTALYALGVVLADHAFDCGLAGIKRSLSGREKETYQRLMDDDQPLASVVAVSTPTVTDVTPADAIGAKSVPPITSPINSAAATQKPAAAPSQPSAGGDAFEHAFVSTPLPASASAQPESGSPEAALPPGWGLGFERMLTGQLSPALRLTGNKVS